MKGNLARSSCFEESRSYSDTSQAPNGGVKAAPPAAAKPAAKPATTNGMNHLLLSPDSCLTVTINYSNVL